MPVHTSSVCTDQGVYVYHFREDLAVIELYPSRIYNKRRKNPQGIDGPVATLVSAARAQQHFDDVCEDSVIESSLRAAANS